MNDDTAQEIVWRVTEIGSFILALSFLMGWSQPFIQLGVPIWLNDLLLIVIALTGVYNFISHYRDS